MVGGRRSWRPQISPLRSLFLFLHFFFVPNWNSLALTLRSASSTQSFKNALSNFNISRIIKALATVITKTAAHTPVSYVSRMGD